MLVPLKSVPVSERHLLFCSHPAVLSPNRPTTPQNAHLEAINRSLAIHDVVVDELLDGYPSITLFCSPDAHFRQCTA